MIMKLFLFPFFCLCISLIHGQTISSNKTNTVVKSKDRTTYTLKFNQDTLSIYSIGVKSLSLKPNSKYLFEVLHNDSTVHSDSVSIPQKDLLYITINLTDEEGINFETQTEKDLRELEERNQEIEELKADFIHIPEGFLINHEKSSEKVQINSFYMCKFEVTQSLWTNIMGERRGYYQGEQFPVESVSWDEVQVFIQKLNEKSGVKYRLPTSEEWEYAAKGGPEQKDSLFAQNLPLDKVGWYSKNCMGTTFPKGRTQDVGTKKPNSIGLHDMNGNVWEWCQDAVREKDHIIRGGGISTGASYCTFTYKNSYSSKTSFIGFRLVRD